MRLINQRPSREGRFALALLPFLLVACLYLFASAARLSENADDRLLPSPARMAETFLALAFEPEQRSDTYILLADTLASLGRLLAGVGFATVTALVLGVAIGLVPRARALLGPFVRVVSVVPPLALLPILFIAFGLGEASKVILIAVGVAPVMVRDLAQRVADIPEELIVKAQTLGASTWTMLVRVVLPTIMPRLLICVRLALGPAWLFLIAAEAIASTEGLGYRLFLVRRYLSMDVILPYVAWITLLAVATDALIAALSRRLYPWSDPARRTP